MKLAPQISYSRTFLFRWAVIALLIKASLFGYFFTQFNQYTDPNWIEAGIAVKTGDTFGYIDPAEDFVQGKGYTSFCRMPGFLPIYAPFSFVLGQTGAFVGVVVFQFFTSVLSILLLAAIAARWIRAEWTFGAVVLLYSISSFVSIWDHYLMSDSFSTSFMIFSLYLLIRFVDSGRWMLLVWSGLFLAWTIFFRQVSLVLVPVYAMLIWFYWTEKLVKRTSALVMFSLPLVLSLGAWTYYNYKKSDRFIPLIASVGECYSTYTPQLLAIDKLIIDWGEDYLRWSQGSLAHWYLWEPWENRDIVLPERLFTSQCNSDSLHALRANYVVFLRDSSAQVREEAGAKVLASVKRFSDAYREEKKLDFYVVNRFRQLRMFLFPTRLDNMPGPAFAQMNALQKGVKLGYYALFVLINLFGVFATVFAFFKQGKNALFWLALPWSFIVPLAVLLGYTEQRYFVPVYPFMLVLAVWFWAFLRKQAMR
jgi:hypothetical protein